MKKTLLLFFALLHASTIIVFAQDDADHYTRLYDKIYKAYVKEPNNVANMLDMAIFYADSINPMHNYATAMKYISAAESEFIEIIQDRNRYREASKLMKKKITIELLRQHKRSITYSARNFLESQDNPSDALLDTYSAAFKDDGLTRRIIDSKRLQSRLAATRQANTLAAYKNFLQNYAATIEGEEAAKEMTSLALSITANAKRETQVDSILDGYLDLAPVQTAAFQRKSDIAYNKLLANPTAQACQSFLTRFPGSNHYSKVLERMDQQLQASFSQLSTPQQFADFAIDYPDNPLAEKAMVKLKKAITDQRDMQALKIYMDNFQLDVDYNDIYLQYYNWHTEEGNLAPIQAFADNNPDFPYQMALKDELKRATVIDSIDISMPFHEKDFRSWASKIYHLTGKKVSFVALQRTLQGFIANKQWNKIPERLDYFTLSFEDHCTDQVAELRSIVLQPADPRINFTPVVRPAYDMLHPVLHPDGRRIFYNRVVDGHLAIQCAVATPAKKNTVWRSTGNINFVNIENADIQLFSLFADGRKMLIGKNGDILVAEDSEAGWFVTETLPQPVNSPYRDYDAFMLPDSSGILLASDRPGGQNLQPSRSLFHGDTALASDIYFVPLTPRGWGNPVNLGISVNSPYMECSPSITDDLKTLYFATDGRGGLGYADIYYVTRDNTNDWQHWSQPRNYGKEVNTGFNEISAILTPDNSTLLISSNAHGHYGCYSATAIHTISSDLVTVNVHSQSVGFSFDIVDAQTHTRLSHTALQPDSSWTTSLYHDKSYILYPRCNGLFMPSIFFSPAQTQSLQPQAYSIATLLNGTTKAIPLPGIAFEPRRSSLTPNSDIDIDGLAHFLQANPQAAAEIISHIDDADDTFSFNLSQARAKEIKNKLILKNIDPDRIILSPYGNSLTKRGQASESISILFHDTHSTH